MEAVVDTDANDLPRYGNAEARTEIERLSGVSSGAFDATPCFISPTHQIIDGSGGIVRVD
jgi:hypothetical protein